MSYIYISSIGQDSHRFCETDSLDCANRKLTLGGVELPGEVPMSGNSDADVILHALTNAVSGITGNNILGGEADKLCLEDGITDSREYLKLALHDLGQWQLVHISISIEAKKPKLKNWIPQIRQSVADLTDLDVSSVGLTATSGEGLTDFGLGKGMQAFCIITVKKDDS